MAGVGNAAYDVSEEDVHVYSNEKAEVGGSKQFQKTNNEKGNVEMLNRKMVILMGVVIGLCVLILILICLVAGISFLALTRESSTENKAGLRVNPTEETLPTVSGQQCSEGWDYLNIPQKCYKFFDRKLNWFEARSLCIFKGGRLAEPRTLEQMKQVLEYANVEVPDQKNVWFGIREWKKDCPTCIRKGLSVMERRKGWVFDSDETEVTYDNWHDIQPDLSQETCLDVYRIDRSKPYKMNNNQCTEYLTLICEKEPNFLTENN